MEVLVLIIFVIGYLAITLEHPLKIDKTVPALIMASLCWATISYFHLDIFEIINGELINLKEELLHSPIFMSEQEKLGHTPAQIESEAYTTSLNTNLVEHLGKTAEILVFLMGAMTIVEIVDMHRGFLMFKKWITTNSRQKLLWIMCGLAFILSAIIDNLTATIVLITILRKIVKNPEERLWYAGMIIIAANAGGAWSPIGDVTTTMLWIANKVTVLKLIEMVLLPSIVCILIPILIVRNKPAFTGELTREDDEELDLYKSSQMMLILGLGMILFVPIYKTLFHLPPYLGMILSLGVVWLVAEFAKPVEDYDDQTKKKFSVHKALSKIEMSSILFFLGILMAVASLEALGYLFNFAQVLESSFSQEVTVMLLGIGSAVIDNVPLVAAAIGMFDYPTDAEFWHFLAFSAGTGGSMLIIGSAAGVAAMGMERISFGWYLKNMSWLALIGFLAGSAMFIAFGYMGLYDA